MATGLAVKKKTRQLQTFFDSYVLYCHLSPSSIGAMQYLLIYFKLKARLQKRFLLRKLNAFLVALNLRQVFCGDKIALKSHVVFTRGIEAATRVVRQKSPV